MTHTEQAIARFTNIIGRSVINVENVDEVRARSPQSGLTDALAMIYVCIEPIAESSSLVYTVGQTDETRAAPIS